MSKIIRIDRRTDTIHVPRAALSAASEDALAAHQSAADAIQRAEQAIWAGNRSAALHAISRIGFEIEQRTAALAKLTRMAESATQCPDGIAAPSHGQAA